MTGRRDFLSLSLGLAVRRTLRIATFAVDVTPPLGTALCYGLVPDAASIGDRLWARGIVLLPSGDRPVVLCAVDWLGIGNGSRDRWHAALAKAAGTTPDRVSVHTVHQHDAPGDDLTAHALLPKGLSLYDEAFAAATVKRVAAAIKTAKPVNVTHTGAGSAKVDSIASNRRILGADGKVAFGRMTACRNSPHCGAPEGVIDPLLRSLSFFENDRRVATLSYYATHPMSYYGKSVVSADSVGMARDKQTDTFQIHFTGAAGNIGAGRYNDGAVENRAVLAARLADAMSRAKTSEDRVAYDGLHWAVSPISMPLREGAGFTEADITKVEKDPKLARNNARYLAFYRLTKAGRRINLSALTLGGARVIHMPGELFVEYQLHAGTAVAAYGDYGPMYIGTAEAYGQGGYETTLVSRVAPRVEEIIKEGIRPLLV